MSQIFEFHNSDEDDFCSVLRLSSDVPRFVELAPFRLDESNANAGKWDSKLNRNNEGTFEISTN